MLTAKPIKVMSKSNFRFKECLFFVKNVFTGIRSYFFFYNKPIRAKYSDKTNLFYKFYMPK